MKTFGHEVSLLVCKNEQRQNVFAYLSVTSSRSQLKLPSCLTRILCFSVSKNPFYITIWMHPKRESSMAKRDCSTASARDKQPIYNWHLKITSFSLEFYTIYWRFPQTLNINITLFFLNTWFCLFFYILFITISKLVFYEVNQNTGRYARLSGCFGYSPSLQIIIN